MLKPLEFNTLSLNAFGLKLVELKRWHWHDTSERGEKRVTSDVFPLM